MASSRLPSPIAPPADARLPALASSTIASERRFFAWLSAAILAAAVLGFARTYLLVPVLGLPADMLPATPLVHLHGATFFAWCVVLTAQSWLVSAGRVRLHRSLGWVGFALYLGLVVTGPLVAVRSVVRQGRPPEELAFLAVSLGNVVAYTLTLGAAFYWRRNTAAHKRLMMIGMVALLTAPFGRLLDLPLQLAHVVGPGFVVLALALWDRRAHGHVHPVTSRLGVAMLAWELAPNLYMRSGWWLATAGWLVDLAG